MKISKETHSRVIVWIENGFLDKFDSLADKERMTRSELLRNCMENAIKKNKVTT